MNKRNTSLVMTGKGCYIPLYVNIDKITLEPSDVRIPANIITTFGPSFFIMHNEWFKNEESIRDQTKIGLLEKGTKLIGLMSFVKKLEKKGIDSNADFVLILEEFEIGEAVSSWVLKGNFQLLLKITLQSNKEF